jgi:NitT/TauT family transport system permease protein
MQEGRRSTAARVLRLTGLRTSRGSRAAGTRRGRVARAAPPAAAILLLLAAWELSSRAELVDPLVLPTFTASVGALIDLAQQEFFWEAVRVTVWEAVAGFTIGAATGLVLGTLIALISFFRRALYPVAIAFQTTPQVALAPLFIVWFGFGLTPRILFAATTCFFPILVSVIVGLGTADPDARTLLRSLGASRWQQFRKLEWPAALPVVFAGIRTAVPLALIGALVGEFVGGNKGMGVLITTFNQQLDMPRAFAVIMMLSLIGLTAFGIVELVDRKVVFWQRRAAES